MPKKKNNQEEFEEMEYEAEVKHVKKPKKFVEADAETFDELELRLAGKKPNKPKKSARSRGRADASHPKHKNVSEVIEEIEDIEADDKPRRTRHTKRAVLTEEEVDEPVPRRSRVDSPDLSEIDIGEEEVVPTKKHHHAEQQQQVPLNILPAINLDDDEGMTVDEALAKVAMLLAKTENPKVQSEVNETEIRHCAALFVVAEKMQDTMLTSFLQNFLLLRVSKSRKGRSELLEIARAAREIPDQKMGRLKSLFQGLR